MDMEWIYVGLNNEYFFQKIVKLAWSYDSLE